MPPATEEGVVCEALPTRHERHLVLQDGCVVANADVVWMLGDQMRIFPDVSPKCLESVGSMLCHIQGNGAVTEWVRKPCPCIRPSQCTLVVLLRTNPMLSGNLEWKQ